MNNRRHADRVSILSQEINAIRLVDTHEHLGSYHSKLRALQDVRLSPVPAEEGWAEAGADILCDLFGNYVSADLIVAGATPEAVERLLDPASGDLETRFDSIRDAWEAARHTGYGEGVELIASEIYGMTDLSVPNLERAQVMLQELQQPGGMLRLLRDTALLDHVQIDDIRWACEADPSAPDFFLHDLSWWGFSSGQFDPADVLSATGIEVRTLEHLRAAMATLFERYAPFAIAVKCQHAYTRTLRWQERSDDEAATALIDVLSSKADDAAALTLGDWCLARGIEMAIAYDLPVKIHTGYYAGHSRMQLDRIRAGHLCSLLQRYPDARFVLMHNSYPYGEELIAVAKHFPNVWVDMCWAWSIDPYSAADFLRRFLHAVPVNKLFAFGGDSSAPTSTVAYSIQARRWLAKTLAQAVDDDDLSESQAVSVAERIMRDNQYACFDIAGRRSTLRAPRQTMAIT